MPIYAYRCTSCGFEKDVMQKISQPRLTYCPACKTENFAKQLTAAGFQLKGTGWYATDFKGGGAKAATANVESATETKTESATPATAAAKTDGVSPAPTGVASTSAPAPASPAPSATVSASGA